MTTIEFTDYGQLREEWLNVARLGMDRRSNWWFRGQSDAEYRLTPTIDRNEPFDEDDVRDDAIRDLLDKFRREVIALELGKLIPLDDAFELLARHHGLPSPWLDWSQSPWIATFFAFHAAEPDQNVAIYCLDRGRLSYSDTATGEDGRDSLEFRDEPELISGNRRAIRQRGTFLRVSTISRPVEELLGDALRRIVVPGRDRETALADLDLMLLNETNLFYDLESAARTAAWRHG